MIAVDSAVTSLISNSLALERSGDLLSALRCARRALEMARAEGEPEQVATALLAVARIRFRLGQYQPARELATEALSLAPADSPARTEALLRLGAYAAVAYSLDEAETLLLQAANLSRELDSLLTRFHALHNLAAGIYLLRGQFDLALAAEEEALRIAREEGLNPWAYFPLIVIAWVFIVTGQPHRAQGALKELEQMVLQGFIGQGYQLYLEADLARSIGDTETARVLYARVRSIAEAIGDPWRNIALRLGMSHCARSAGNAPAARAWADGALNLAIRSEHRHEQGIALVARGRAYWLGGDLEAAEADLRAAIDLLIPLQAACDLASAWLLLAALRAARGTPFAELRTAWLEAVSRIVSGGHVFLLEQERALAFPLLASFLIAVTLRR